ncbi:DNA-protecting protein DprA [Nocardia puris]|uniref:DNA-processing protein DprA n=1 Tax=Nocardia TaxID=1817 RepID=UPI0009DE0CB8|nr:MULTISPECIES: DNA-processing protein DprA [Nocardia]MBF6137250.1 DNA-protecting protein DprA [Nocardia otitidiscaviarum]MBF6216258.1 DNA-protecting protein DprA [Nocardia puris]MBF6461747.1 DNA-protecting protein DprA [Nocardia puris]MBF6488146.1 DNA-protecting protein DprA [Nocardia otitidiscaviarum]
MSIDRLAWALLSRAASGPCGPLTALIDQIGPSRAALMLQSGDLPVDQNVLDRGASGLKAAARDLDLVERLGGRLVTPEDDEWPQEMLECLPSRSDNVGDAPPVALWVRGDRSLREVTDRAVAVIGARASTDCGNHVATEIAADLAGSGWTVAAGAAFGIEAAAHRAVMAVGGVTVAVMPCGLDRPYPFAHDRLLDAIADDGLVVTEYPPGSTARRQTFLDRNRLVAALSAATVVVEAGARSGAASTLRWAARFGRPVLAVPGPVTSAASAGCHRFIADGDAQLVTCADDIRQTLVSHSGPTR